MTAYRYRAALPSGRITSGEVEAVSPAAAKALLASRDLHPISFTETQTAGGNRRLRRLPAHDLALVFRSIAALVAAGVPVDRALASSAGLATGRLRTILQNALERLREGQPLGSALDDSSDSIPPVVLGLIRAGERRSGIDMALEQAAAHLEQEAELAASLRQALAYPLLLAVTGSISAGVIIIVVVPRFAALLTDTGQSVPMATKILLTASAVGTRHGLTIVGAILLFAVGLIAWIHRPGGALSLHHLLLRLPFIGPVRHSRATSRVCQTLGSALQSGMPPLAAMDAASEAAADHAIAARGSRVKQRIARGEQIATSMEQEAMVTAHAAQLLAVGEGSGRIGTMAERAGVLAAKEAERRLRTALALLEPVLIAAFGGLVTLVAIALLQAVYSVKP